jgi:hypothetical protein
MMGNPILGGDYLSGPNNSFHSQLPTKHKKIASTSNLPGGLYTAGRTLPTPVSALHPFGEDPNSNYDGSSRSTSAYSIMPNSAGPLLNAFHHPTPAYPTTFGMLEPLKFRLPSDQVHQIASAVNAKSQAQQALDAAISMPPPPVPQRPLASNTGINGHPTAKPESVSQPQSDALDQVGDVIKVSTDRRGDSRYSDVSMHNNCTSFPTCTTEDSEGRVVHNPPTAPATVVKGKKEGSSAAKRKSSSSEKQSDRAEKRPVRRSSRLLQHDSGHPGASSDSLNGSNNAVIEPSGGPVQEANPISSQISESE